MGGLESLKIRYMAEAIKSLNPEEYRLLNVGEEIVPSDELFSAGRWHLAGNAHANGTVTNEGSYPYGYQRRKL